MAGMFTEDIVKSNLSASSYHIVDNLGKYDGLLPEEVVKTIELYRETVTKCQDEIHNLQVENCRLNHDLKIATEMVEDLSHIVEMYVTMLKRVM